jgi:hypothetical protein
MSQLLHEMSLIVFNLLSAREQKKIHFIRVRDTGRASLRIPTDAPYNFGVNQTWLASNRDDPRYHGLLLDWGKWPNPEGFETNALAAGEQLQVDLENNDASEN